MVFTSLLYSSHSRYPGICWQCIAPGPEPAQKSPAFHSSTFFQQNCQAADTERVALVLTNLWQHTHSFENTFTCMTGSPVLTTAYTTFFFLHFIFKLCCVGMLSTARCLQWSYHSNDYESSRGSQWTVLGAVCTRPKMGSILSSFHSYCTS